MLDIDAPGRAASAIGGVMVDMRKFCIMGAAAFLLANPVIVLAQSETAADNGALEEVVVTAQRREESSQRAAVALTALAGSVISDAGITNAAGLTAMVPALQINSTFGPTSAFRLRGVGNIVTNSLGDPAVAVNIDGVFLARPTSVQGLFYDLERVEVLKGPQGTLYGRNATGGAINVISAKPKLGEFGGFAEVEFGSYSNRRVSGALNLPAGANDAFRVATQIVDRDGFYNDGTGDDKSQSARLQYAHAAGETWKFDAGIDYTHQGGQGAGGTVHGLDPDSYIGLFDPRADAMYASAFSFAAGNFLQPLVKDIHNDNTYWGAYAQVEASTPVGTVTILPSYRRSSLDFRSYGSGFAVTSKETDTQKSLEVRLVSKVSAPLSYILGGYYFNEDNDAHTGYGQQFFAAYTHFQPKTDSYAGYLRLTYSLTNALRVSGGVRYTTDRKSARMDSPQGLVICPGFTNTNPPGSGPPCIGGPILPNTMDAPALLFAPDGSVIPFQPFGATGNFLVGSRLQLNPSKSFDKTTYRVGVEFDVAPESLLYATYETGFKSGGFFVSIDDPSYGPETIDSITLGSKNRFLDDRLQLNLELFNWTYKNQQLAHFRFNSQGGAEYVTENIGRTRIRGGELELNARVLRNTLLQSTVQYLDARNQEFVYRNPTLVGPPTTGCPFGIDTQNPIYFVVDCSGTRPAQAPQWTITGGVEQSIPLRSAGDLKVALRSRYQSESITGFEQLPNQVQKSYTTSDASLAYVVPKGNLTVTAFVNNVEDKGAVGFSQPHPRAPSLLIDMLRPPRTYGLRVGVTF